MLAVERPVRIMSNQASPEASAGTGNPYSAARATTCRRAPWAAFNRAAKSGAIIRLRAGSSVRAAAMSFSIDDRMMQPARQTRAISGSGIGQSNAFEAAAIIAKPCA